jgi:hypothetical protein
MVTQWRRKNGTRIKNPGSSDPPSLPNTPSLNPSNFETNPPISLLGSSLLVRADEGRPLDAFGHKVVVLLDGEQTKNNTDQPIRVFINIAPAGFERFFAEAAEEWARPEYDMSRITAISKKYGIHSA